MSILRDAIKMRSLLEAQLPVSGVVRLGVKNISAKARSNPSVLKLFEQALAGEITMKQAEMEAFKLGVKQPFYPTNTQHFNIHPLEVEGGRTTVDKLIEAYGEDRGFGRKIYSFPVTFPDVPNGIDGVFKSKFEVHQGPTKYSSEYTDAGQRICVYRAPIDVSKQALRKKFVAREKKVRGACDPATCPEFAAAACRFQGTLHFYIPGASGSGTWILKTGSTYASEDVFLRLDDLYTRCKGRLPNFTPDGTPVFVLTKKLKTMKYFDEHGQEKKSDQWVLSLETLIDMSKLMLIEERKQFALAAPSVVPTATPEVPGVPEAWLAGTAQEAQPASPVTSVVKIAETLEAGSDPSTGAPDTESVLDEINSLVMEAGIDDEVEEWAGYKFGNDWFDHFDKAKSVFEDVKSMLDQVGKEYVKDFLPMVCMMYENTLFPQEIGVPYIKAKYKLRVPEQRHEAGQHIKDLIKLGSVEAKRRMQEFLSAQAPKK